MLPLAELLSCSRSDNLENFIQLEQKWQNNENPFSTQQKKEKKWMVLSIFFILQIGENFYFVLCHCWLSISSAMFYHSTDHTELTLNSI